MLTQGWSAGIPIEEMPNAENFSAFLKKLLSGETRITIPQHSKREREVGKEVFVPKRIWHRQH